MSKRNPHRDAAITNGETYYFTGTPCRHGHVAKRYVKSRSCVECQKAGQRRNNKTEKRRAYMREYMAVWSKSDKGRKYFDAYAEKRRKKK